MRRDVRIALEFENTSSARPIALAERKLGVEQETKA